MKSEEKIKKEYMDLKLEDFSKWYIKLSDSEKVVFNKVISKMRDEFFNNKKDNNA